ncbi:DUF4878 domain-containing protein [Vandammella animalimorsus]|uniref:DUF4878 domain-containing protein n=1 Tax=Vandammella animalimorsus TaxID=2029117 RepID=UPI0031B9C9A6
MSGHRQTMIETINATSGLVALHTGGNRMKLQSLIRWGAVLCVAGTLSACSDVGSSPEATAKAFIKGVYGGDADAALKLVHIPNGSPGEAEMAQGKVRAGVAEAKAKADKQGGFKDVEIKASEISPQDPNRANTTLRVVFKQGEKQERVRTIKVDGKWKVRIF